MVTFCRFCLNLVDNITLFDMSAISNLIFTMHMKEDNRLRLMATESARLKTYEALWPKQCNYVDYKELAREGFYYTGKSKILYLLLLDKYMKIYVDYILIFFLF